MVITKHDVDDIVKLLLVNNQKALQGYAIASLYYRVGEYKAALRYVAKFLAIVPHSSFAYKLQGECYEKLNQPVDALRSYENAIKLAEKKRRMKQLELNDRSSLAIAPPNSEKEVLYVDAEESGTCSEAIIKFTVNNVSTLDRFTCSQPFSFQNYSWRIVILPKRDHGPSRSMSFYLLCYGDPDNELWSCNVDAEYKLLSSKPNQYPYVAKLRHLFNSQEETWGFPQFISWNDAIRPDGKYVNAKDDSITVEVNLTLVN